MHGRDNPRDSSPKERFLASREGFSKASPFIVHRQLERVVALGDGDGGRKAVVGAIEGPGGLPNDAQGIPRLELHVMQHAADVLGQLGDLTLSINFPSVVVFGRCVGADSFRRPQIKRFSLSREKQRGKDVGTASVGVPSNALVGGRKIGDLDLPDPDGTWLNLGVARVP